MRPTRLSLFGIIILFMAFNSGCESIKGLRSEHRREDMRQKLTCSDMPCEELKDWLAAGGLEKAKQGDTHSQYLMASIYREGINTPIDYEKSKKWYELAAKGGSAAAMNELGIIHLDGLGVAPDPQQAMSWFLKSSQHKHDYTPAIVNMGSMYYEGKGVPIDYKIASAYFSQAAELGDDSAMVFLGAMYVRGEGVNLDYKTAAQWYQRAAVKDNSLARAKLGFMYAQGKGVPMNHIEAYVLLREAAKSQNLQENWPDVYQQVNDAIISLKERMSSSELKGQGSN